MKLFSSLTHHKGVTLALAVVVLHYNVFVWDNYGNLQICPAKPYSRVTINNLIVSIINNIQPPAIADTVYVQIFEGCNKSRISTILFSWISCYHTLYFKCITTVYKNFEDLNFVDDKLPVKTAKFTSLKNLYVYGI